MPPLSPPKRLLLGPGPSMVAPRVYEAMGKPIVGVVAALEKMHLEMHVASGNRLWTLNTPRVPAGVDDTKVRKRLLDEYGIEILGGFGPLAGKVFRIGLMGSSSTEENVALLMEALQNALVEERGQVAKG